MPTFYLVYYEYVGPNRAGKQDKIQVLPNPGRTNMSNEVKLQGWLGTTDDWCATALGAYDEAGARELLRENHIAIPDTVPVRYVAYVPDNEVYNQEFAYPYDGPPYLIPAEEQRWVQYPATVERAWVVRDTCGSEMWGVDIYQVRISVTGLIHAGVYEITLNTENKAAAEALAGELPGTVCDPFRLYHPMR